MSPDWLAELAPAHAPPRVSWWPPAAGWWALTACLLVLLALLARWLCSQGRALRHKALTELQLIRRSDADGPAVARAIQSLMRRYAVAMFGREHVAKLTGAAWLEFIVSEGGTALAGGPGRSLLIAAFGNHSMDDREHWLSAAESFIRRAARRRRGRRGRRP
jgi:Domain of unknown function (DUF4381)